MSWSPRGRAQWLRVPGGSAAGHATVARGGSGTHIAGPVRRVLAVVALARVAQFVEAVLFPLVAVRHGAGTAAAALVLLALAVGTMAGSAVGGAAIDRAGPRLVATAGLALASAAAAGLAIASAAVPLALAAAIYGVATGAWRLALEAATAHALAADAQETGVGADQAKRERAFGTLLWVVNLGALASAAAYAFGLDARLAVGLQALTMGAAAVLALMLLAPRIAAGGALPAPPRPGLGLREVPREVWVLAIAYAPFTMVMFQAFAGLAEIFPGADYRLMVLVNAITLVAFPPLLWSLVTRADGVVALTVAGAAQGAGVAAAALTTDPILTTIAWSAGEATLIAVIPAVVAGIAPHGATGSYRAAFAIVQGGAAAVATFAGPLLAHASAPAFALACVALSVIGVAATAAHGRSIGTGLRQPVACPCGALLCSCDAAHLECAPSPVRVHRAAPLTTA